MFAEIFQAVTGVSIKSETCVLPGYECLKLAGQVYPGIQEKRRCSVQGFLYKGLSQPQLHRLDQYEGDEYVRELVLVRNEHHRYYSTWVYVLQPKYHKLLVNNRWDPAEFERLYLSEYLANLNKQNYS
jgi:hypothetical protein